LEEFVMRTGFCLIATILLSWISEPYAADQLPWQQEFDPPNGKRRVVVVVTGQTGPRSYAYYAKEIASQGFYPVLVNGNDFWNKGFWEEGVGEARLRAVISRARQSVHAFPGKAAVITTREGFTQKTAKTAKIRFWTESILNIHRLEL
jgi:hypothetical protein